MRRVLALALAILLMILPAVRADTQDPWDIRNQNRILNVVASPQLAPGEAGVFSFNFTNPYGSRMQNTSLNVSIYQYATIEEYMPVDASWRWEFPKIRESGGREYRVMRGLPMDVLLRGETLVENFTVLTSQDMPHGSVFAQSSYFLRFWLEFDFNNGTRNVHLVMASRGYFTNRQWDDARNTSVGCSPYNPVNRCIGSLNLTRLSVDGILPDSSFGVKEPIPIWPFYGLLVLTGFFLVLAFLFWVEENPNRYPRVERAWLIFKGRLRRLVRLPIRRKV